MNENLKLEDFKELAVLFTLSDENFKIASEAVLTNIKNLLKDKSYLKEIKDELSRNNLTINDYLENMEKSIESIDESLNDENISSDKIDFFKKIVTEIGNALKDDENSLFIPIELTDDRAKIPAYAHITDAGADLYALEDITIEPGKTKLIPTGLKVAIPEGYELQIRPKSGRCLNSKLRIANTPATIDSGYRGEICVIVENIESQIKDIAIARDPITGALVDMQILYGLPHTIGEGEKFAQLVLNKIEKASFYKVKSVDEFESDGRDEGGFGSTGLK